MQLLLIRLLLAFLLKVMIQKPSKIYILMLKALYYQRNSKLRLELLNFNNYVLVERICICSGVQVTRFSS